MLVRLEGAFDQELHITADVFHELRTPSLSSQRRRDVPGTGGINRLRIARLPYGFPDYVENLEGHRSRLLASAKPCTPVAD